MYLGCQELVAEEEIALGLDLTDFGGVGGKNSSLEENSILFLRELGQLGEGKFKHLIILHEDFWNYGDGRENF